MLLLMPSLPPANVISVARAGQAVYARTQGLGNFSNALMFEEFCEAELQQGAECFVIDLAECTGMDSTFMGVMAGLSTHFPPGRSAIVILNASPKNRQLLDDLGLSTLVAVRDKPDEIPQMEMQPLASDALPARERAERIRRAHQQLVDADSRNAAKFGPVLKLLQKELDASR